MTDGAGQGGQLCIFCSRHLDLQICLLNFVQVNDSCKLRFSLCEPQAIPCLELSSVATAGGANVAHGAGQEGQLEAEHRGAAGCQGCWSSDNQDVHHAGVWGAAAGSFACNASASGSRQAFSTLKHGPSFFCAISNGPCFGALSFPAFIGVCCRLAEGSTAVRTFSVAHAAAA